jgi:8-oxo-dGTP pyrophosphatase MutT (NUDIX family)
MVRCDTRMTAPRPKDAATLILIRQTATGPLILMGRRSSGHSFMPDKYVFPGGKVDRGDRFEATYSELEVSQHEALLAHNKSRHPRAFALAAIRETWEETGLLVGRARSKAPSSRFKSWQTYAACGAIPDLGKLHFIGRAITPPMRSKRFDARFFMADADEALLDDRPPQDGAEMLDLRWFSYDDALDLDLPSVTRFILGEVAARLREPNLEHRPSFLRWGKSGHLMDRL